MFAIGEIRKTVQKGKIDMPVEYKLRHKKIYGIWAGEEVLYLSDEVPALKAKHKGMVYEPHIDSNNCLHIPSSYNNRQVRIRGMISTIQILFLERGEVDV